MRHSRPHIVVAVLETIKNQGCMGMSYGLASIIRQKVLLRDIGDVGTDICGRPLICKG